MFHYVDDEPDIRFSGLNSGGSVAIQGGHLYEKNIRFIVGNRLYFCRIRMQKRQHHDRNINTHQQLHSVRSNIIYQQSKHE